MLSNFKTGEVTNYHLGFGGKKQMASEKFKNSDRNSSVNLDIFRYQIK